ncbi:MULTISPECIES: endonuclease MutS2 [Allofournierella]|uniref:Endonuclease MutS2 n=1 Tax=Allofournierella massiliensis TaxID=1650663 RepID=A0ABT7UUA8_9FIRM|nr:endonuclease MutS2 [Fournierella massiliensis]MDM8202462.1 endonuclease MutS2 [Fournierella massiliensis]OUN12632.1 endonuclease MutS2 [Gemmiger sp. An87]
MEKSYLKTLELEKILNRAAQLAVCPEARTLLLEQDAFETVEEVRYALSQTDAINTLLLKNGSPRFGGVQGVDKVVNRALKGGILSMAELLEVAGALRNFQNLVSWYHITEHDMLPVDDLFYALTPQPTLEKNISSAILSPEEMADTASNTLFEIRRKIRAMENSIRDKLDAIIKNSTTNKFLQDAVVSLRNGRFVVPVKAEYRGEVGGVIHDVSSSGSTVFVEPTAVVEANAKIMQLRSQEKSEIERILAAFTDQVASIEPVFNFSYQAMLNIDVLLAKARLALEQQAYMPQVADGMWFDLKKARHPLIDKDKVVPVDVALGKEYDTLVITGPNTGGKTVTLKTAGLLCAMAQHGLLIPAHEQSTVCVFSEYLVDIGDEQSIEQSLSTFSGHMKKITGILDNAYKNTLVLLDELGAGTDPAEGAALAVSIIEQLRIQGALIMATTHYSEMKVFALETPGVMNASCEFDVESLRPTYKLSVGVPGKSNAFLISEKLGVPPRVIQRAQTHLTNDDKRLDSVLAQLDDLKLQLKASQDEVEKAKAEAEHKLESARKKYDALVKQGETELEAARLKARQMAQQVQDEAYRLTDELRKLQKDEKTSAAQRAARAREIARKETESLYGKTDVVHNVVKEFVPLKQVKVGQEVVIADIEQTATVMSLPDRNGLVEVRAGILKTKVPLSNLKAPDKLKKPANNGKPKPQPRSTTVQRVQRKASMEINLLGMTVEEALMETDQFIDHAVMNGQTMVYLIHGKGTGALRKAIHAHLRGHRNVKSFRLGQYGEGEAGVTVVELK